MFFKAVLTSNINWALSYLCTVLVAVHNCTAVINIYLSRYKSIQVYAICFSKSKKFLDTSVLTMCKLFISFAH